MIEITLIRHAESQANVDGIWNGQVDGPLSAAGEESLDAIGKRLHEREFDVSKPPFEWSLQRSERRERSRKSMLASLLAPVGEPYEKRARIPVSWSARNAASAYSGLRTLWHQSCTNVIPE